MSDRPNNSKPNKERNEQETAERSNYGEVSETIFPGGHRLVVDNGKGKEGVRFFHAKGSSICFEPDGKMIIKTIGEQRIENEAGVTLSVGQCSDVHVTGHGKITVGGGITIQITGDVGLLVGGSVSIAALGDMNLSAGGNMNLNTQKNFNINAAENMKTDVKGNSETVVNGAKAETTHGESIYESDGAMYLGSGAGTIIEAPTTDLNPGDGVSGFTERVTTSHG